MNLVEATKRRIKEFITDNRSLTKICLDSNLTPSTIFDFMYGKSKYPSIITIKKLCYGLNITLSEFFDKEYFDDFDDIVNN